ncbi:methyltransferase domain-containing protein [Aromatoleum toluvorans]|uniref:Malonyl-[acyl-carrier protein] O-methyltransferase n=1 Tax=Aromatoleum toluvorans TaxID=92002 RepID=A0ABX1Q095_9RHOO|nr:methyltransferase domain-containing protein [Aromatoleum toluvorans]NMG45106.1 methyltransferase domain-containing protein [Aromatoleum toluvorans]
MTEHRRHKQQVRKAFDRAADSYDRAAAVQREVCHRLAALAAGTLPSGPVSRILDAGCGTGFGLDLVARSHPAVHLVALDFAPAMLARLRQHRPAGEISPLCADLEALPLAAGSIDAVWSSLALQWCDPALALGQLADALRPGGVAWIATLGPATLWELREAFARVDAASHVIGFHAPSAWIAAAENVGLTLIARDLDPAYALAPDLRGLLRDIKAIGAHSVGEQRRRKPLGRAAWRTLEAAYETHRRPDGLLPATYDLILLALRKPETSHD